MDLVTEYQKKNLYVFCAARDIEGKTSVIEQLLEGGVQIGWPTRIVPFSPEISGVVFALGFAVRAAMAFGGVKPGGGSEEPDLQEGPYLRLRQRRVHHPR